MIVSSPQRDALPSPPLPTHKIDLRKDLDENSPSWTSLRLVTRAIEALATHPSLTHLNLVTLELDEKYVLSLLSSPTITDISMSISLSKNFPDALLLAANPFFVSIIFFNRLGPSLDEISACSQQTVHRNRAHLLNWQRVTVLLAFYRANRENAIRDSILSLMNDVLPFLWEEQFDEFDMRKSTT